MFEQPVKREQLRKIVEFLQPLPLFKNIGRSFLYELASSMKIVHAAGGEVIVKQGDADKILFILYHGRLGVFQSENPETNLREIPITELGPGQIFGEISLLSNYSRIRSVIAIRDCVLLRLDEEAFKKIEKNYPVEVLELSKQAITRIITKPRQQNANKKIKAISIAPAGDSDHRLLLDLLYQELNKSHPTILVNRDICTRHFNLDCASVGVDHPLNTEISDWLTSLEDKYSYVLYETDNTLTTWTERCLRQSDRIFFAVQENVSHVLNSIEIAVYNHRNSYPSLDLIFLHEGSHISGTRKWLDLRPINNYLHINQHSIKDLERLIRFINGSSFGVVMNGGGARGMAHIGALMSLEDMDIPIDFISGCSMGAFISAQYAKGLSAPEILDMAQRGLSKYKNEYALPLVSLMTGESIDDVCKVLGGDLLIEDLPYPFFCVSANLTQGTLEVFDKGPLWLALRSSISIPGIFPPIYNEVGDTIVDGGILNNMPVDIMRKVMGSGEILAINCSVQAKLRARFINETAFTSWKYFIDKLNPFTRKRDAHDSIFNTILLSMHLSANQKEKLMSEEADYYLELDTQRFNLLEFFRLNEIVEYSYKDSKEKLLKIFGSDSI